MLGDVVYEGQGHTTGTRMLPSEGDGPQMEVSIQGSSKVLGVDGMDVWTYNQRLRADGSIAGQGQGATMTVDGPIFWTGQGIGHPTGKGMGASYRVSIQAQTESPKFARLNGVVIVGEYEVAENGDFSFKGWEWK